MNQPQDTNYQTQFVQPYNSQSQQQYIQQPYQKQYAHQPFLQQIMQSPIGKLHVQQSINMINNNMDTSINN